MRKTKDEMYTNNTKQESAKIEIPSFLQRLSTWVRCCIVLVKVSKVSKVLHLKPLEVRLAAVTRIYNQFRGNMARR